MNSIPPDTYGFTWHLALALPKPGTIYNSLKTCFYLFDYLTTGANPTEKFGNKSAYSFVN